MVTIALAASARVVRAAAARPVPAWLVLPALAGTAATAARTAAAKVLPRHPLS